MALTLAKTFIMLKNMTETKNISDSIILMSFLRSWSGIP